MNEVVLEVNNSKNFRELSNTVIVKVKIFDELIERLNFYFKFNDKLFSNYRLQSLKNEFSITNVLSHLLFCCRSPNSNEGQCSSCSRLYVKDADDFISSIKYPFSLIFSNDKIFSNEIKLLFVKSRKMKFDLDILYSSETHFQLLDFKQNRCISFLAAMQPCDIIVFCPKFKLEF